jgi:hypothetical protein
MRSFLERGIPLDSVVAFNDLVGGLSWADKKASEDAE